MNNMVDVDVKQNIMTSLIFVIEELRFLIGIYGSLNGFILFILVVLKECCKAQWT